MAKNKNRHIIVIASCLLSVMVAIMPLLSINHKKTTANADGVVSNNYFVVLPSFFFNHRQVQCVMPSMFLSVVNDTQVSFYGCNSSDGYKGYYLGNYYVIGKRLPTITHLHYITYVQTSNSYVTRFVDPGFSTYVYFGGDFSRISSATTVSVSATHDNVNGYGFRYGFYEFVNSSSPICYIDISNFDDTLTYFGDTNFFVYTTITAPVDIADLNSYLYDTGYQEGYHRGYDTGIRATWKDLSPWQAVVNGVNDFLSLKLFGNVSMSVVLSIAFGCILLGFAIKIFLGG